MCIPSTFETELILKICRELAAGNDYIDYLEGSGEPVIGNKG